DTFCGSCGTFLEWTGQKVGVPAAPAAPAAPGAPPAAPAPPREEERKGSFFDRMQRKVMYAGVSSKEKIDRPAIIPGTPGAMPPRPGMPPGAGGPPRPPGAPGMPPG